MEGGFLYKVNDHTTELIRSNLDGPINYGTMT